MKRQKLDTEHKKLSADGNHSKPHKDTHKNKCRDHILNHNREYHINEEPFRYGLGYSAKTYDYCCPIKHTY